VKRYTKARGEFDFGRQFREIGLTEPQKLRQTVKSSAFWGLMSGSRLTIGEQSVIVDTPLPAHQASDIYV
jgi:hypothetical protein